MTLFFGIKDADDIFKRYSGISGSFYFLAGVYVNYQWNADAMRSGMGLMIGANAG